MDFVDSHLHLWDRSRLRYDWLDDAPALPDRFVREDLLGRTRHEPEGIVFIESGAAPEQAVEEACWASALAERWGAVRAFVAAAPVEHGDAVADHLDRLTELPVVRGVRRLLHDETDEWLAQPALAAGLRAVAAAGLVFDACIRSWQLERLTALRRAAPEGVVVLDHLAKPPLAAGWGSDAAAAWRTDLARFAAEPGTYVKLSGLALEAGPGPVLPQARPFLIAAVEVFGPERCMAASDWPVSGGPGTISYDDWIEGLSGLGLRGDEQERVLRGTAAEVYFGAGTDT